ncbi:MAG: glycosyltransferase [Muribaculaceae bacterium]|nr:glycosyltransferase [Muribaculaceae bacterium]
MCSTSSSAKTIAVLIPCYNEAATITKVVTEVKTALPQADVYVYDNNSTDGTGDLASEAGAIVRNEPRQGKGNVIRSMFRQIEADCYIMLDGDDTYPVQAMPLMARLVCDNGVDMVIGDCLSSTYLTVNKRKYHNFGNLLVRFLINRLFKSNVPDIMSGYRAFSRLFVKTFPVLTQGFEIETEMTIYALDNNYVIESVPIQYTDRPAGSTSKLNTVTDGIKVVRTIFSLFVKYRPLMSFSVLASLLLLLGLVGMIPIFAEYFATGLVPRFPTLIVCGFVVMLAMLLEMCGLVLHVLNTRHKQLTELAMNRL